MREKSRPHRSISEVKSESPTNDVNNNNSTNGCTDSAKEFSTISSSATTTPNIGEHSNTPVTVPVTLVKPAELKAEVISIVQSITLSVPPTNEKSTGDEAMSCFQEMLRKQQESKKKRTKGNNANTLAQDFYSNQTITKHNIRRRDYNTGNGIYESDQSGYSASEDKDEKPTRGRGHHSHSNHHKSSSSSNYQSDEDVKVGGGSSDDESYKSFKKSPSNISDTDTGLDKSENDIHSQSEKEKDENLSSVQRFILKALRANGGSAHLSTIQEYLSDKWSRLRKRDGSKYTYDHKRVISASLSNTSTYNPLFQRDLAAGEGHWMIGPRGKTVELEDTEDELANSEEENDSSSNGVNNSNNQINQNNQNNQNNNSNNNNTANTNNNTPSTGLKSLSSKFFKKKNINISNTPNSNNSSTVELDLSTPSSPHKSDDIKIEDESSNNGTVIVEQMKSLSKMKKNRNSLNNSNNSISTDNTSPPVSVKPEIDSNKEVENSSPTNNNSISVSLTRRRFRKRKVDSDLTSVTSTSNLTENDDSKDISTTGSDSKIEDEAKSPSIKKKKNETNMDDDQNNNNNNENDKSPNSSPTLLSNGTGGATVGTTVAAGTPGRKRKQTFKLEDDDKMEIDDENGNTSDSDDSDDTDLSSSEDNTLQPSHLLDIVSRAIFENGGSCPLSDIINYIKEYFITFHCTLTPEDKIKKLKRTKSLPDLPEKRLRESIERGMAEYPTRFQKDQKSPDVWHSSKSMHTMRASARNLSPPFQALIPTPRKYKQRSSTRNSTNTTSVTTKI